ncbi:MAG: type II toxin-antitoxin system ParD family antitoxin [Okeania sp. SIO3I5]|uniref:type II toxin-antitoxin system ParD family antitoxin n=1 Tax=Okeania sp. SIO3I5 TaxID=2607805 RepID=UPI0013BCFA7B|nr:type II toxin-antitoxin system ParD family antitoxin [Okeania sp. SIO3I5]NEQ35507.1 type II toxin-antitoxin system ParD family antitoxin [Okeania sp. SIO3I5]
MKTLNISIPESMQEFVNQQVASGNYNNASEYILHLIYRHQQETNELETMLLEGINSGPPTEVIESWWEEKRSALVEKFSNRER